MLMTIATGSARIRPGTDVTLLPQRNYDSTLGRFTSFDTFEGNIDDPSTLNRYAYAQSNLVNLVDPSGHDPIGDVLVSISIGTTLSGLAGAAVYNQVFHDNAIKGFLVGGELGFALSYAYFSGGEERAA